ncbi:MAG: ATP-dependent DNA helicase [Gammaproteobacteria bacterium]|nr:ATP-dependent DNA helicase [Gammaproteobacteria bacterium]MBL7000961.1 ATP-dependent DNA helicase [Gammaproteobacteria bacterium]
MAKLAVELNVAEVLGTDGIISQYIPGFQARSSQLAMAELIQNAIEHRQSHVIEASTGIGKSFAYLVPAFLSSGKILISTGTKNLQDQLFKKDIPLINKTIVSGKQLALLKGRSNYGCIHRIDKYRLQRRFQSRQYLSIFEALKHWSEKTKTGDIAEFSNIPENDPLWFYATSNADNCLGSDCPEYNDCFVTKARRKAQDADVIVINHHLFFSDQAIREEGFGELLPEVDVLIFDEAHQLPDVASHFFGQSLTMRQYDLLMKDIIDAQTVEARDSKDIQELCHLNQKTIADFRLVLGKFNPKGEWRNIQHAPEIRAAVTELQRVMGQLAEHLDILKARGKELAACAQRLDNLIKVLAGFLQSSSEVVTWYEWNERSFRLMISPVEVSQQFRQQIDRSLYKSIFFTSATLSSNGSFDYFTRRLGIQDLSCATFISPFDYKKQALLYLPQNIPEPTDMAYADAFADECCTLINATQGYCFILFTSYRMLKLTATALSRRLKNKLFIQGEHQRSELIEKYLKTPNPVLLGTSSFWEGVDVKGDKLKLVIIDKLPFKSPGDPVYKRRLQRVAENGGNAFKEIQIPEATISLRQGVGRLIRDINDRGIVMIADKRLQSKPYAREILDSLPPMERALSLEQVLEFAVKL